jgi:hypothetical protein
MEDVNVKHGKVYQGFAILEFLPCPGPFSSHGRATCTSRFSIGDWNRENRAAKIKV